MHNPLFKPSTSCHLETLSSITAIHLIKTVTFDSCLQLFSPIFHLPDPELSIPMSENPTGETIVLQIGEENRLNTVIRNLPEQKPVSRHLQKTQYWGRKAWTAIDELLEVHYGQVGATKGALMLSWILPLGTLPNCPSKYQGESAFMLSAGGEGKESFWNMPQQPGLHKVHRH